MIQEDTEPGNLAPGSEISTDSAYTDYTVEDDLLEISFHPVESDAYA